MLLLYHIFRYHLTGWYPEDPAFALHASNYKSYLDSYCALAAELQINIVPGTIVEAHPCPSGSPKLLNVAYFISPAGVILGSYQKSNLWIDERAHLTAVLPPRSPHQVITTPLGPVGILACWDLSVPEAFRVLVAQGAKIIIIPAFWTGLGSAPAGLKRNPGFEKMILQSLVTARAFENTSAIVFNNVGGAEGEGDLGLSQVVMPFSGPLREPLAGGERLGVIDIDMDELEDAEEFYKIRSDMSRDSWRYRISDSAARHDAAPAHPSL